MDRREFIKKYYTDKYDFSKWNRWMESVNDAFEKSKQEELRKKWGLEGKGKYFDFDAMQNFYEKIKNDNKFEDDINKFLSFLVCDHYFEFNNLTVDEFLNAKDINKAKKKNDDPKNLSINELSKIEGGQNYIRDLLIGMNWWRM